VTKERIIIAILLAIVVWFAAVIVRLENHRYASVLGTRFWPKPSAAMVRPDPRGRVNLSSTARKDQGMGVKHGIAAAVTSLVLSAAIGAPAAAQQSGSLASDSSFIQMAGSVGLLQAKLGKLAAQKGSSAAVVEFGKRITADYSKTNEELATAAKQAAYPAPLLLRQHQKIVDRFTRMGRSSFDKEYMAEVVKHHSEAVRLFRQESEGGRVQSLKQLASRMLPQLEQRLTLASETGSAVGADVTAARSEGSQGSSGN
jgi:putative membrane protein